MQPACSWGVVRQVKFPGVNIDAGHVRNLTWAKDNDAKKWVAYNRLRGQYMSALEGAIPERLFNDTSKCNIVGSPQQTQGLPNCNQGISAIKALQVAASQGQKIYTITQAVYANNPNVVNSALFAHSASTKQAVSNALNAGMEVTIHESPITIDGWTGAGYTKIDPSTGAGGYMIDGGGNGGVLKMPEMAVLLNLLIIAGQFFIKGFADIYSVFDNVFRNIKDVLDKCADPIAGVGILLLEYYALSLMMGGLMTASILQPELSPIALLIGGLGGAVVALTASIILKDCKK